MKNGLELLVKVPADCVGELFAKGLESVIARCTIEVPQKGNEGGHKDKPSAPTNQNTGTTVTPGYTPKKLIKYICPTCGALNYAVVERDAGAYKMRCVGCREESIFREPELKKVEYVCTGCEKDCIYFTPDIEDMTVRTNQCKCGTYQEVSYSVAEGKFIAKEKW